MSSFHDDLRILDTELQAVVQAFGELTDDQWATPTKLRPFDEQLPPWTLFELAGHFDISIGLTRMLIADTDNVAGQVGRDRISFFIFSRSEVAPVVYDYAYTMVEGKTPAQMPGVLRETFGKTVEESRATGPDKIGTGYTR
ncbi:MAG: maleylpyruvate isomerase N-terminal domain-containing protein [Sporichthyaceae bacterium]|nr:maleylpyruvate isomerase N-terminal domain-containing protein [Sporichthyaceae bacterium]